MHEQYKILAFPFDRTQRTTLAEKKHCRKLTLRRKIDTLVQIIASLQSKSMGEINTMSNV